MRIIDIEIDDIATFKAIIEILNGAVPEANAEIIRDIHAHTESFNKKHNANKQNNDTSNKGKSDSKNTKTNNNDSDSDEESENESDDSNESEAETDSEMESEEESDDVKHKSRSGKATIPKNVMLNKNKTKKQSDTESDADTDTEDASDSGDDSNNDHDMVVDSESESEEEVKPTKKTSVKASGKKTSDKDIPKSDNKGKSASATATASAKGKRGRQPKKDIDTDNETNSDKKSSATKSQKKANNTASDSKNKSSKKVASGKASNNSNTNSNTNSNSKNDKKEDAKSNADNPGQIKILTTDTNQVMIIYISLEGCAFKKFVVRPERYTIGLNLDELHKYIKNVDKEGVMTMHMDSEDTQHVVFDVKSANLATTESICELRVVNLATKNDRKIEVDCSMVIRVNCSAFHKACKDLLQFSRYVEITCDPSQMALTCKGELSTHKRIFRVDGTQDGVVIKTMAKEGAKGPEIIRLVFDLTYINMMYKCSTLCDDMEIYLNSESIMFLKYGIKLMGRMVVGISPTNASKSSNKEDYDINNEEFYNDDEEIELLDA